MSLPRLAVVLPVLLLAACAHAPNEQAAADCSPRDAWERVRAGVATQAACEADDYLRAARLARELGGLEAQRAQLDASLAGLDAASPAVGQTRRRIRQIDVDIEAIRGVAVTRGLVDNQQSLDTD
ncbi:MAG: hypothetical protein KDI75_00195 [Xanthomonadales bacterium]|nr:hypothetical protein [Xanthomonadales bacterium]